MQISPLQQFYNTKRLEHRELLFKFLRDRNPAAGHEEWKERILDGIDRLANLEAARCSLCYYMAITWYMSQYTDTTTGVPPLFPNIQSLLANIDYIDAQILDLRPALHRETQHYFEAVPNDEYVFWCMVTTYKTFFSMF